MEIMLMIAHVIGSCIAIYLVTTLIYVFKSHNYKQGDVDDSAKDAYNPRIRPFNRRQLESLNKFV
jgi:hypothetical protein